MSEMRQEKPRLLWQLTLAGLCALVALTGCKTKNIQEERGTFQEAMAPSPMPADTGATEIAVEWRNGAGNGALNGFAILQPELTTKGLLTASRQGVVSLFDPISGKRAWQNDLDTDIFAGVAAADGLVVVGLDNGQVVALNEDDGTEKWRVPINRQISSIAAIGRARVVVRTSDGLIVALRADNGERVWIIERSVPQLSMHGDSAPVITGDAVLVGLPNGRLIANNVVTGREYWETDLGFSRGTNEIERLSDADTSPLVQGNQIFTAVYQGSVSSLRLNDASVIWKTPVSTRQALSLLDGNLYVTDDLGGVVALGAEDGNILWHNKGLQGRGISHPIAMGSRILVGDSAGNLHSFDKKDGTLIETLSTTDGAIRALLKKDGLIIAYSSAGELVAVSLRKRFDL